MEKECVFILPQEHWTADWRVIRSPINGAHETLDPSDLSELSDLPPGIGGDIDHDDATIQDVSRADVSGCSKELTDFASA